MYAQAPGSREKKNATVTCGHSGSILMGLWLSPPNDAVLLSYQAQFPRTKTSTSDINMVPHIQRQGIVPFHQRLRVHLITHVTIAVESSLCNSAPVTRAHIHLYHLVSRSQKKKKTSLSSP